MPTIIPAARIQRGPGFDDLASNQSALQSIVKGLSSIQGARQNNANQDFLSQLAAANQSGDPNAIRQAVNTPQQGPQGFLGKLTGAINPFGSSGGFAPEQQRMLTELVQDQLNPETALQQEYLQARIDAINALTKQRGRIDPLDQSLTQARIDATNALTKQRGRIDPLDQSLTQSRIDATNALTKQRGRIDPLDQSLTQSRIDATNALTKQRQTSTGKSSSIKVSVFDEIEYNLLLDQEEELMTARNEALANPDTPRRILSGFSMQLRKIQEKKDALRKKYNLSSTAPAATTQAAPAAAPAAAPQATIIKDTPALRQQLRAMVNSGDPTQIAEAEAIFSRVQ